MTVSFIANFQLSKIDFHTPPLCGKTLHHGAEQADPDRIRAVVKGFSIFRKESGSGACQKWEVGNIALKTGNYILPAFLIAPVYKSSLDHHGRSSALSSPRRYRYFPR